MKLYQAGSKAANKEDLDLKLKPEMRREPEWCQSHSGSPKSSQSSSGPW